ncbi:hypothetical protein [Rhodoblastus sp.]|jgi:excisionase family DNA binding protein|uniref:hypothetical protein n=1 Tax=Rhodoblastus sp. TaxID=1962975 RepID=UPI0025D7A194|nr:hypothetical protein [Rhodoblastus sp.]
MNHDNLNLPEAVQFRIEEIRARQRADHRGAVSIREASGLLGLAEITVRKKIGSGEIVSQKDGRARRIPIGEIYDRMVRVVVAGAAKPEARK